MTMKKFEFSKTSEPLIFNGPTFYRLYKDAEFLRNSENVEEILCRGYQLRQHLKKSAPGEYKAVGNMVIARNVPLLVKNTSGPNMPVEGFEFTYNRLMGLTAAYAYDNRQRFPILNISDAKALGLVWDIECPIKCKLYLSAVSGTEHFEQFSFYPLMCGLRKLKLNKIDLKSVVKIAKVKNGDGLIMASVLKTNLDEAANLWKMFKGTNNEDLKKMFITAPPELKVLFERT